MSKKFTTSKCWTFSSCVTSSNSRKSFFRTLKRAIFVSRRRIRWTSIMISMRGPEYQVGLIEYSVKKVNLGDYLMIVCIGFMAVTTGRSSRCFSLILKRAFRSLKIRPLRPQRVNLCDYWTKYCLLEGFNSCKMMYFLTCFFYYFQHPFFTFIILLLLCTNPEDPGPNT